jgi:hypothetical protein
VSIPSLFHCRGANHRVSSVIVMAFVSLALSLGFCTVSEAVGFYISQIAAGDNLFAIQLYNNKADDPPVRLNDFVLMGNTTVPDGTTVRLWDSVVRQLTAPSTYHLESGWDINYAIPLGDGMLLHAPTAFGAIVVGEERLDDWTPLPRNNGLHLLCSRFPMFGGYVPSFQHFAGRGPLEGDLVRRLDRSSQTYSTTIYHNGAWNHGWPSIEAGESAWFGLQLSNAGLLSGDADLDGTVNITDLSKVLTNYDKTDRTWLDGDFNGDLAVNVGDMSAILTNYNKSVTAHFTTVPEPSAIALLGIGLVSLMACARWRWRAGLHLLLNIRQTGRGQPATGKGPVQRALLPMPSLPSIRRQQG